MSRYKTNEEPESNNQEKLVINSLSDLIKISIEEIYNLNLYNFRGDYFNKLYKEAIRSETLLETEVPSLNKTIEYPKKTHKRKKTKYKNNNHRIKSKSTVKNNLTDEDNSIIIPPNDSLMKDKNSSGNYHINKIKFSIKYNTCYGEELAILGSTSNLGFWKLSEGLKLKWNEGNVWTGEININNKDFKNFEFKFVVVENNNIKLWQNGENNVFNYDELINNLKSYRVGKFNKYEYEYDENNSSIIIKCYW